MTQSRGVLPFCLMAVLASCSTSPVSFMTATPRPADDAYSCALRKVNELGYTVTNADRGAGFIAATKQTSGLGTKLFLGSEYHDHLTISVFDGDGGSRSIRATAGRVDKKSNVFGQKAEAIAPTEKGMTDANTVLSACGEGEVTKQGDFTLESSTIKTRKVEGSQHLGSSDLSASSRPE